MIRRSAALAMALALWWQPLDADAFCGFYVSGADQSLFNNATQVVLMREGTRTVLSMQNSYKGPTSDFAMVVPVPVVLQEENVKTLPEEIFDRVDQLAAPRLVEYWEQDPCRQLEYDKMEMVRGAAPPTAEAGAVDDSTGVTVEAQFEVGEYQIVILSAVDSTGLDTWLKREKYKIPEGSEPYLRPYVEGGSKFFVARVDAEKVKFVDGQAMLSPLRFHYDSTEFWLPVRLGLMNSEGTQDLIVHILAPGQRYEVANYPNVTIPTNFDVVDEARGRFGEFYAALFDRTLEKNKGAVITEYAWDASTCDPCPTPALDQGELLTLGLDVLRQPAAKAKSALPAKKPRDAVDELRAPPSPPPPPPPMPGGGFVLTRLHARYQKDALGEDLIFKAAKPIAGGREWRDESGELEHGAVDSPQNMFQGRYAIRHPWEGPIDCESPRRGVWGGPPAGVSGTQQPTAATDLAFVARGKVSLPAMVAADIPEIGVEAGAPDPAPAGTAPTEAGGKKKDKGCQAAGGATWPLALLVLAMMSAASRRRRNA